MRADLSCCLLLICLAWLSAPAAWAAAPGAITRGELRAYLATHPTQKSYTPAINPVIAVLTSARGPRAAATQLASSWAIPVAQAEAVLALVVRKEGARPGRLANAVARITQASPPSREAWRVVLGYLDEHEQCGDTTIRERYFRADWAVSDLLQGESVYCLDWWLEVPRHGLPGPLLYARLAAHLEGEAGAGADELLALRAFRDALLRQGAPPSDPARLHAERSYWVALAEHGLWRPLLAEAHALSAEDQVAILDPRTAQIPILVEGFPLERAEHTARIARHLQPAWLISLLSAGQVREARQWVRRWGWDAAELRALGRSGPIADEELQRQDLALRLVDDSPQDDAFEVFVNHGYLSGDLLGSASGRELAVGYLTRHAYPELGAYLKGLPCADPLGRARLSWDAFPADFQALRTELAGWMAQAAEGHNCAPDPRETEQNPGFAAHTELPLPPRLRWRGRHPSAAWIPPRARHALQDVNVVRYSRVGSRAAAISLSQDVDPVGEVSGGGYWLHLSDDKGRTWKPPLYLGLQQYFPYVVVPRSRLPLLKDRTLQIEVEVRELDLRSITFPPLGLATRRTARDLYIELPLDEIERDSDGDGLTDLLEARLLTDPHERDTDHDGLDDGIDPLPQVSVRAPPTVDLAVMRMALQAVLGYDTDAVIAGAPASSERPGQLAASAGPRLPAPSGAAALPGSVHHNVLYLQTDPALLQGLTLPDRVVVVTPEEARAWRRTHGLFFPVELHVWFNHAGTRAAVLWSAGWVGGALLLSKKDGRWQEPQRINDWITRAACLPGKGCRQRAGPV
jgi:hypothetical protein